MPDDPHDLAGDLGAQLNRYIDDAAPAVTLDEARDRALEGVELPSVRGRSDRRRAFAAIAAALLLLAGLLALVRAPRSNDQLAAGPGTTAPSEDLSWLTPLGAEKPAPPVPAGWKLLEVQDMRFAVPSDWSTPLSRSCANLAVGASSASGAVFASDGAPGTTCGNAEVFLPASTMDIVRDAAPLTGTTPTTVGTWTATFTPKSCPVCAVAYHLTNGYLVQATGPDADRVLATFTDAGRSQALSSGPVASSTGWQTVTSGGVSLEVPRSWNTVDLVASTTQTTGPDGAVVQISGTANPGTCTNGALFPRGSSPSAFWGSAPVTPSCPARPSKDLEPGDGAWIRPEPSTTHAREVVARGRLHGLEAEVLALGTDDVRSPAPIELLIHVGAATQRLSIGVGLDPSIARAILRSIRPAGAARTPTSVTGPGTTARPASGDPYCAAVRAYLRDFSTQRTVEGGSDVTYQVAAVDESRRRLHEIAGLAPPDVAADWATLADAVPGQDLAPEVYRRIDASVVQRCRITMAGTEVDHPGSTPIPGVTIKTGP